MKPSLDSSSVVSHWLALLLLVPVPSLGAYAGMVLWPNTALGAGIFGFSKVWLLLLPVVWLLRVDRQRLSGSPIRQGGLVVGLLTGLAISAGIGLVYGLLADSLLDVGQMRTQLEAVGLLEPSTYLLMAVYWITINSVLEEYVWRWFVVSKSAAVFGRAAVPLSALFFTLHHIVALKVYFGWLPTLLCSLGVFIGGVIWSWMYAKYRSIWPGYLSHAIVDLAIFTIGWQLLFVS